jgi:metallo-beta-lactamase family protein
MSGGFKISFFGGAREVTGANHLFETESAKILIDCGIFQGSKTCEERNWEAFPYDPREIDFLFVTHGHLDHIGRIPKLVRDGFQGKIISTGPTRDFSELMLVDSLGILTKEAKREGREVFYTKEDIGKAMLLWETHDYDGKIQIGDLRIFLRDAGHILGSAMVEINYGGRKILFTGDLGNPPVPILREPYKPFDVDYLVIESTYGDRVHEGKAERKLKLERVIEDTVNRKGVLMIPAFSIERTQELLFELNDLVEHGRIPKVPIFLDSPLAIQATGIYQKYERYYGSEARSIINSGDDIFEFPGLHFTLTTSSSKAINDIPAPKVIIAGSGMSTGGRIIHHEKRYLSDPRNTLLLIGFQVAGTLGRILEDGAKKVTILGDKIPIKAQIEPLKGYSAHPDREGLYRFVKHSSDRLKQVFVVQGEPKSALFFVQKIRDYLGIEAIAPALGDSFEIGYNK